MKQWGESISRGLRSQGDNEDEAALGRKGYIHGACDVRTFYQAAIRDLLHDLMADAFFIHGSASVREEKLEHIAKTHGVTLP